MQSKTDRRVKLSPLGYKQKWESRNVSKIMEVPLERRVPVQFTARHEPKALLQWLSSKPLKSFLIVLRGALAKQKRVLRRRLRTKSCH
ncbi:hypothetical protein V6N13_077448 [Hibiscus sabdariffa]